MGVEDQCSYQIFPKTWSGPAEYCLEDREEDSDYCYLHEPALMEPDWDDIRKDLLVGKFDCE